MKRHFVMLVIPLSVALLLPAGAKASQSTVQASDATTPPLQPQDAIGPPATDNKTEANTLDTFVLRVRALTMPPSDKRPTYARLNDTIWIDVQYLQEWIDGLKKAGKLKSEGIGDVVPFFDGIPLSGVHPQNPAVPADTSYENKSVKNVPVHHLRFALTRFDDESSRRAWSRFLNQPVYSRRMTVSVGFENGSEIQTFVEAASKNPGEQFYLTVIPGWPFVAGLVVIGGALVLFFILAYQTDIVRDTSAPLRPDGLSPYSLGRSQMAIWFFLVIASYFLLWVVTGDTDTLNSSVLGLIGISAGTALSSAIIDAGKTSSDDRGSNVAPIDLTMKRSDIIAQLKERRATEEDRLRQLRDSRSTIAATDQSALAANDDLQAATRKKIGALKRQIMFFSSQPWKRVMYDLLAENDAIAFHRFQIFVWTLILAIMFVLKVYNELAMPDFSATLLGLLGISAGTYIGFKFPDKKENAVN